MGTNVMGMAAKLPTEKEMESRRKKKKKVYGRIVDLHMIQSLSSIPLTSYKYFEYLPLCLN